MTKRALGDWERNTPIAQAKAYTLCLSSSRRASQGRFMVCQSIQWQVNSENSGGDFWWQRIRWKGGSVNRRNHSFVMESKLHDVKGRVDYISSPKRQKNLYAVFSNVEDSYWKLLAEQNQRGILQKVERKEPALKPESWLLCYRRAWSIMTMRFYWNI